MGRCRSRPEKSQRWVPHLPYLVPKVWKAESRYWRGSSIPSIPSIPRRAGACAGARARAGVHGGVQTRAREFFRSGRYGRYGRTSTGAGFGAPYLQTQVWKVWNPMSSSNGSMREQMPECAAFVDMLRVVFGADQVDPSIRAGMRGEPNRFHAVEGGHELGTPFDPRREGEQGGV